MSELATLAGLVVTALAQLLPVLGASSTGQVASIINLLIQIIPVAVKEAADLVQPIQNIIAALQANPASTADQLATLDTLNAQCDAAFEAAATAAGDPAPAATSATTGS